MFEESFGTYKAGPFRSMYGNDETVFEAWPYRIPSISLTRWPFPEYHTDHDTPDRISKEHLHETLLVAEKICETLEMTAQFYPKFRGLVCLSKFDLYLQPKFLPDGSFDAESIEGRRFRLMNTLPSLLGENFDIFEIAKEYSLPVRGIYEYLLKWEQAGLVERR